MAYRCTLKKNLKFSNGEKLDAKAVKYSIDRIRDIHFKGGPVGMLGSLDRVETKGDDTVVFHLNKSDATFPFILATPAMSLVAPGDYRQDKIRDDGKVTGSGPYLLESYEGRKTARAEEEPGLQGLRQPEERRGHHPLLREVRRHGERAQGRRDRRHLPGLTAEEVVSLEDNKDDNAGLQIVESTGADIRFLVFNPKDPAAANPAVRKAIAHVVDRDALVAKVYRGTAEPSTP